MNQYMALAIDAARNGMDSGKGGPFGAVVVRKDQVIAVACNEVFAQNDPTAHAEVMAIRKACRALDSFLLEDCELYATCEPCPMCMSATFFAGIKKLHYGATRHDSTIGGFDDVLCYELAHETLDHPLLTEAEIVNREECAELFRLWKDKADRIRFCEGENTSGK